MTPDNASPIMDALIFIENRWKIITGVCLAISWVAGVEFRLRLIEKRSPKRTVKDCAELMSHCNLINSERFNDGRREFDGFSAALNRLSDHIENRQELVEARLHDREKTVDDKLQKIINHLLDIKK